MSSFLSLVLGLAYFYGALAYTLPTTANSIQIPIINQSLCLQLTSVPSRTEIRRPDYTYTPGIGAHKVHTIPQTWHAAWRICRNEGGHLAIINSYAESMLIGQLLVSAGPHAGWEKHSHIGFHDFFLKNEWVTIFGQSLVEAGFNEWALNEPNDVENNERCGSVDKDGKLNDHRCHILSGFVCELPHVES